MVQLILVLTLLSALPQQPQQPQTLPDSQTVALAFENHRFEIVAIEQARKEFNALVKLQSRTAEQEKRFAALVWALGIIPTDFIVCEGHQPLCETTRGRRLPLQPPSRN